VFKRQKINGMNDKEKWLKEHLAASRVLDVGERQSIDGLNSKAISEADLSSCIDILEVQLSVDALPPLVELMKDSSRQISIRQQAARAIHKIGVDYVRSELENLNTSNSEELRHLAKIALEGSITFCK